MAFWNRSISDNSDDTSEDDVTEETTDEEETSDEDDTSAEAIFNEDSFLDLYLKSIQVIGKKEALEIPAVSSAIEKIASIVSTLDVELYKVVHVDGECKAELVKHDQRVELVNQDTGDTLDGVMFKKALVRDYYLCGEAHAYINRTTRNKVKSIHYVDAMYVAYDEGVDPIFKDYDILVNGKRYMPYDFLTITRNSKDGYHGTSIIDENNNVLQVGYKMVLEELRQIKNGGQKKGYIKSKNRLSTKAMNELKSAWRKLTSSDENVIVLNEGLDFGEISNTAVETQMKEKKDSNTKDIYALFGISDINDDEDVIKNAVMPFLNAFEKALDRVLLLESEKRNEYYFKFDTRNLMKGTIKERYEAYNSAIKAGWITRNEARYAEDMEKIEGLDLITFSLGEVIYDIEEKKYFTPNTGDERNLSDDNTENKNDDQPKDGDLTDNGGKIEGGGTDEN